MCLIQLAKCKAEKVVVTTREEVETVPVIYAWMLLKNDILGVDILGS